MTWVLALVTENPYLRTVLVWSDQRIFRKPLPAFLLSYDFWDTYLCDDPILFKNVQGLLVSYVWLVQYQSDLKMAKDDGLLPEHVQWNDWRTFADTILRRLDPDTLEHVNKRYVYGELRMHRLNQIY